MPIEFPSSPSNNQTFTVLGRTYKFAGNRWRKVRPALATVQPSLEVDNDFAAAGTLHVDADTGRVGIGTANPAVELHVDGNVEFTGTLDVTGIITTPTPLSTTNDTTVATTAYVTTAISDLIGGAPAALDTLNELAAALNDDASYAATITTALAGKLDSSSYTAADVLAKLITVDGAGSSLDADTLDGSHASAFAASVHTHSYAATSHTHSYLPTSGGTLSGNLVFSGDSYIQFEGSTADGYETFLRATNPTADRTIYLPNAGGTLSLDGHTHSYISTSTTQSSQLYIRNTSPTVYFRDTDHRSAMIHVNSSIFYVLRGSGNDSTTWETYNGHWPLTLNLNNNDATFGGDIYMRSVNNNRPTINRVGGIYFTWDSDSYGTNDQHSIRSTNGDTWGDHITINSYGNVRINIDSNGNGNNTFSIGRHTTGTANELLTVDESGNIGVAGYVESAGQIRSVGVYNAATPATNDLIHCATSAYQYRFFRSTSVRASKKDIEPLDDAHADLLLQAQPVWYRSAMPQDDDRLSYYGFIAEDMAELDPRFANWGVSNDCQCTEEQLATYEHTFDHPPECVVPTGIPYERLTAHLTNLVQRQHARIESLESRIEALEAN